MERLYNGLTIEIQAPPEYNCYLFQHVMYLATHCCGITDSEDPDAPYG